MLVVRGRIELPTPRFSGTRHDANWPNCGELSESAVAEAIVGWTDLDGDRVGAPNGVGRWHGECLENGKAKGWEDGRVRNWEAGLVMRGRW